MLDIIRDPADSLRRLVASSGAPLCARSLCVLLVAVLAGLLLAPVAEARGGGGRDGFDFGDPKAPKRPDRKPDGDTEPEKAPTELTPMQREVLALRDWPGRKGKLAAEALFLRGNEAVPYLVKVLNDGDERLHPGAAWVLGKVSTDPVHVQVILRAAAKRPNASRSDDFFKAAYGLDAKVTKRWLISFISVGARPVFRNESAKFLASVVEESDRPEVLQLLEARKDTVRIAGLGLLGPAGVPDAEERLLEALSDVSAAVASKASIVLAMQAVEELDESNSPLLTRLNKLAREGHARERAYATLALAEAMRIQPSNVFESPTISELIGRRGILHPERLNRGASAVGLVFGALDSSDKSITGLLDGTVVDILVNTVGGDHFRDYSSLLEPSFAALRRVSGRDLAPTAVAWAQWWQQNRGTFRARRPLTGISATDLPRAYVRYTAIEANGRRRAALFVPAEGDLKPGAFLLSNSVFRSLLDAVEDAGIFRSKDRRNPRADEHIAIVLGVYNQERRMVLIPSTTETGYLRLKMRMQSLIDANIWQRYRDKDKHKDVRDWWRRNTKAMAEAAPDQRDRMLQAAIVYAYDDLRDDDHRAEALDRLMRMRGRLSNTQLKTLAGAISSGASFGTMEADAMRWIIAQADGQTREALVDPVASRLEPRAQEILAGLLRNAGVERIRAAFSDTRPGMRAAAARAARLYVQAPPKVLGPGELGTVAQRLRPGLEVLALDQEPRVAVEALVALAYLGDAGMAVRLEQIYKGGNLGVKLLVTEALGNLPGDQGHPMLTLIVGEERARGSGQLRAAALRSMASANHPNVARLLVSYLINDPDATVKRVAGSTLAKIGTTDALAVLLGRLRNAKLEAPARARLLEVISLFDNPMVDPFLRQSLGDQDLQVVTAAALGAATRRLPEAVPYLISLMSRGEGGDRDRALTALEGLTSLRFEGTGYALLAERYEAWYEQNRGGNPRSWLRDALKRRGYDTGGMNTYVEKGREAGDLSAVPLLIRVLRDPDPLLRQGAAAALEELTGTSHGEVRRTTSSRDAARIADQWLSWMNGQGGQPR